ncbi:MAG TPA: MFS transporter, partial [Burkholderiaceae bacterium]|nr:MFS transporter [Burkholderiaceae bacterium]
MAYLTGRPALTVFGWFSCAYFLSYALRSVNAVIAPDLVAQFGLSHAQLGALSAAYFLAFAMMQLPLGVCLDRFGSRRTDASLLLVSALGCVVFALAANPAALWIGRALIGAGVCGALMSALKGYRFW